MIHVDEICEPVGPHPIRCDEDRVYSGPPPNIKTVFPRYAHSFVKDKTVGETVLSLTWESLYW